MNIPVLIVACISFLALGAHLFVGTKETASISPEHADEKLLANWVQAMCAFQMLSIDLLVIASLLLIIAILDLGATENVILLIAIGLYALWGVVWILQMIWLSETNVSLYRLPQWLVWFFCSGLLGWGYMLQPL